jgi:cell division protein FtsB
MTTDTKQDLYRLIDELPEAELHAARRFLEHLVHEGKQADDADREVAEQPSVRQPVADDLRMREAIRETARRRGQTVKEGRSVSGHTFKLEPAGEESGEPETGRHISSSDSARMTESEHLDIHWVSEDESRAMFDERARELLGMSGDEFLRRYDAGEYDGIADDPDHPEIMRLVALVPLGR